MNQKENFEKSKKDESNKEKEKIDFKLPFDMKTFWKSTDEKYFKPLQDTDINEPNHLIKLHSKYGSILLV